MMCCLNRSKHPIALMCALTILVNLASPALMKAEENKKLTWDNVLRLRKSDTVGVVLSSGASQTGKVDQVEPTTLGLNTREGALLIPRENIRSITYVGRPKVANPGMWMIVGGIGLASAGLLGGTLKDVSDINRGILTSSTGKRGTGFAIAGFGVAAAGVVTLFKFGKAKLIYESKSK